MNDVPKPPGGCKSWLSWALEMLDKEVRPVYATERRYARIEMARLHIELERMRQALEQGGICPTCLHEYTHDITEPFAHCGCPGTIEWTGPLPLIFRLRHGL